MNPIRAAVAGALAALAVSGSAFGQETHDACAREAIPKVEHDGVAWRPGPEGEQIPLWPAGLAIQPPDEDRPETTGNGSPLVAGRKWNWATFVTRPTMTVYRPAQQSSRGALLVLPGGGYAAVAMDLEGTEICDWVTQQGLTCIVLKYRTPQAWRRNGQPPDVLLPLQDAQRAMGLLRQHATDYGVDPHQLGVIGFSAGAHLAAAISNAEARTYNPVDPADQLSSRPDFAVLLYAGRLWDRTAARTSLKLAPWVAISPDAPPTLLIHAMNDPIDDVRNAMAYGLALHEAGVAVDMRIYAGGCHAFGLRPTSEPITRQWPGMMLQWLQDIRMF